MPVTLKRLKYEVLYEALKGEIACGDHYIIKELDDSILIAVIDGLGHGEEAAFAAKKAATVMEENADKTVEQIFHICNQELADTRGVVMTALKVDANYKLRYMAIGNVMGVCWKIDKDKLIRLPLFTEGGIVGSRIPAFVREKEVIINPGATLILATDGIKTEFEIESPTFESPDVIAQRIFTSYRNIKDDGLVLVAQFG